MKKNFTYIITLLLFANTNFVYAQNNGCIYIEGINNMPFMIAMDNNGFVQSLNNGILFQNVPMGNHEFLISMASKGQLIKNTFTIINDNAESIAMQLSISDKNEIVISKKEMTNKEIIAKAEPVFKQKKKSFLDKLLGENVDGQDVKQFGLYKQGITDANETQYAILQKNKLKLEKENQNGTQKPEIVVAKTTAEPIISKNSTTVQMPAKTNIQKNTIQLNTAEEKNSVSKSKKESGLKLIGDFFTERSRENDEVKINHPAKNKVKAVKKESVKEDVVLAVITEKKELKTKAELVTLKSNAKQLEELKKQKINAEYEAKQLELNKMKAEKERLDAISILEKQQIEKAKFLQTQQNRIAAENAIAAEQKSLSEKLENEKQKALATEEKLKASAALAMQKKADAEKAKMIALENAKKDALAKLKIQKEVEAKLEAEEQIKISAANKLKIEKEAAQAKLRMEKEANEAKIKLVEEEKIAKKKALEESKIAANKIKEQAAYAKKQEQVEKAKLALAEKKEKEELAERIALEKAEAHAADQKMKEEKIAAAKWIEEQKEITAKKELIAAQAKLTMAALEIKKSEESAAIESAKQEASEWKAKYETEQKAKLELEIRAKLTAELNAKMEDERKAKEIETALAAKALEKAKLTKLEKKANKVANRPNPNCSVLYTEDDLVSFFQKLESKIDDESRLNYSKKLLKDKKCFTCKDLEQLAQSYNTQTGKYSFLQAMFPFVQDNENYELLENVFKYESYKAKVRLEFGGEQAVKN